MCHTSLERERETGLFGITRGSILTPRGRQILVRLHIVRRTIYRIENTPTKSISDGQACCKVNK